MTPNEIQNKTFEKKMSGYRVEEVTAYLGEVADYVQNLLDQKEEMEQKMVVLAEKVEEYREDEDSLRAALIGAQKLGDSVVRDAKRKAEMLLTEASRKAEDLVNDAKSNIDREAIALSRMQEQVTEFKTQILAMYKRQVEIISAIPEEAALPGDVKKIVDNVSVLDTEEMGFKGRSEKADNFTVTFDAEEEPEDGESTSEAGSGVKTSKSGHTSHKRADYGNLRFGEEYNLTRTD